ncbi:C1QL [Mytilus coruscus]|uniref:C1QL n=1 Tax=Mytilus coruscus TaxID=42192 RepID=A0A6J8E0R8_MYTCO|nr:C1QL [Mytilus coruscus]
MISMPLVDDIGATLKADLDVTKMNKYLHEYIQQEVSIGVSKAMGETVEKMVKNKTHAVQTELEAKIAHQMNQFEKKDREKYAFFAHLSSIKESLSDETVVIFDKAPLNVGGGYDTASGKFTCKDAGLYFFSWTTLSQPRKDFTSALFVNGGGIAENIVDNDETGDAMTGSNSAVVRLRKGDLAWIGVVGNEGNYIRYTWTKNIPASVFTGFKIY